MAAATSGATTVATRKQRNKKQQLQPKKRIRNKTKSKEQKKKKFSTNKVRNSEKDNLKGAKPAKIVAASGNNNVVQWANASQQLNYFVNQYQSANDAKLSTLELESLKETCFIELCQDPARQTTSGLSEHVKNSFGSSWNEELCEKEIEEGSEPGNPALLVISSSAIRSLELLREFRSLTKECHAAKLFSKHMKIEEQVSILKNRVNIASGTPSRIKKLIDMDALGLSRLAVILIDMHIDIKGYSLFTLKQISEDFWELYKIYFHQPLLEGKLRLCLYGPVPCNSEPKVERDEVNL